MERSEPSLVPEWLRSAATGVSSSKSDGPLLALPKRNRNLNASGYSEASNASNNSRRSCISSSNGSSKHDNNPYARSYSRNQRAKDRENLGISDTWDNRYSDPLESIIIGGRKEKYTLKRSQSMISKRADELIQRRSFNDSRNRSNNMNGNGAHKVSFERDFPLLVIDERPTTPDLARVPSPGLSRGIQGLSIANSPFIACEGWTSALAEVPVVASNNAVSSPSLQSDNGSTASSAPTPSEAGVTNGLNMAEALVQGPVRPQSVPQQSVSTIKFEELPAVGIKKLIPMTSSMPKSSMLNPSDKLKPKTGTRSSDGVASPKNGLHHLPSSLQLGIQTAGRVGIARPDVSASSKLQLLKPVREKVVSPSLKDAPSPTPTVKVPTSVSNVQSIASPTPTSHPFKNPNNLKQFNKYSLNSVQVVDKRLSLAQLQSRNDFFNLVRKKSMGSTSSSDANSSGIVSPVVQNSGEDKEMGSGLEGPTENENEIIFIGEPCKLTENFSDQRSGSESSPPELIHPEEELDFLRALGWEDNGGDDEGLTEEEINAFVQKYMKWRPDSKLLQGLQLKAMAESNSPASCPTSENS